MWPRQARGGAAGFSKAVLHTEPGLNHTDFSETEMKLYAAFVVQLFPQLKEAVRQKTRNPL